MKYFWLLISMCLSAGCSDRMLPASAENSADASASTVPQHDVQVAFLADIHLHDFIAAANSLDSADLPVMPGTDTPLLMRSMQAQLNSTRLFNENYFVFRAALDDIAQRGIRLVALPGDFSDDGQPANVSALSRILDDYHQRYNMRFFAITGNHDPTRPFTRAGGKSDFLDKQGREVGVYSPDHPACQNGSAWQCSNALREWGYADIMQTLSQHGFSPQQADVLYETPFDTVDQSKRGWQWCDEASTCIFMPDASYLVEPVEGIWLLAIDANVYVPKGNFADRVFDGSGNAGYNALLKYKPELIQWISQVVQRAEQQGKRLVAFSHFPMADFYDNTQRQLENLFGKSGMQMARMLTAETTRALAATGLKLHMAGHMHLYDVAAAAQSGLVNVQVPSLAAYQPGYSIVTFHANHTTSVETVIQQQVPAFDTLFPIYRQEWQYRQQSGLANWSKGILDSRDYLDFTDGHLQEVVRQRFVGREWPAPLAQWIRSHQVKDAIALMSCEGHQVNIPPDLADQPAMVLANDYYRLRNAGQFANLADRQSLYSSLPDLVGACDNHYTDAENAVARFLLLLGDVAGKPDAKAITIKNL